MQLQFTMPRACSVTNCTRPYTTNGFCTAHYKRWLRHGNPLAGGPFISKAPAEKRFWDKVDKNGPIPERRPDLGSCWLWTASQNGVGYGQFMPSPHQPPAKSHRYAYELMVGPIPVGMELDHLCHVPLCVRPSHLEPVIHPINVRRGDAFITFRKSANGAKTHCPQGHLYDEANTYIGRKGGRWCRACRKRWPRKRQ